MKTIYEVQKKGEQGHAKRVYCLIIIKHFQEGVTQKRKFQRTCKHVGTGSKKARSRAA
jgi:hypothetical protein